MSTSAYRSEQLVHYSHEPATYFGWYISWSGGEDDSGYPFNTPERRDQWVEHVRARFPGLDAYDLEMLAAMLCLATWGPESSRDGVWFAVQERYPDCELLEDDITEGFDPSETRKAD